MSYNNIVHTPTRESSFILFFCFYVKVYITNSLNQIIVIVWKYLDFSKIRPTILFVNFRSEKNVFNIKLNPYCHILHRPHEMLWWINIQIKPKWKLFVFSCVATIYLALSFCPSFCTSVYPSFWLSQIFKIEILESIQDCSIRK